MDPHPDTVRHRARVQALMGELTWLLEARAAEHDLSKTNPPEVEAFNAVTDQLSGLEYGSPEYKDALRDLGPALDHHYAQNRHHPEWHAEGINGMTLLDLVELICDWAAAVERVHAGNLEKSVEINRERFGLTDQIVRIILNTYESMGLLPKSGDART